MQQKTIISFLASHGGSSARRIIAAIQQGAIEAVVGVLITNNHDSAIYQWCRDNGIAVRHISGKTHPDPKLEDRAILQALDQANTGLVVLSGYMKKIGPLTLSSYSGNILNIHPSLLPKFGGHGMYGDRVHKAVLEAGETVSGASVHIINEEYDEGPILMQREVPVLNDDSVESLRTRVQGIESDLYIDAIREFLRRT